MKELSERRVIRLHINVPALFAALKRDGYLDIPGQTQIPPDGRVIGMHTCPLGSFLEIDIEADSLGDTFSLTSAHPNRVMLHLPGKEFVHGERPGEFIRAEDIADPVSAVS